MARKKRGSAATVDPEEAQKPSSVRIALAKAFPSFVKMPDLSAELSEIQASPLKQPKPRLPRVNLLPPHMVLEVKRRAIVRGMVVAALFLIVGMGGIWYSQSTDIVIATAAVETKELELQLVRTEADKLRPIGGYFNSVQERLSTIEARYFDQIDYSAILLGLKGAAPPGVTLTEVAVTYIPLTAPEAPACGASSSPFVQSNERGIGCVEFFGTAVSSEALQTFQASLENSQTIKAAGLTWTPAEGDISFTGTGVVPVSAAFSNTAPPLADTASIPGWEESEDANAPATEQPTEPATDTPASAAAPIRRDAP